MKYLNGFLIFDNYNEMIYNYLLEMGLVVRQDQYLAYQDSGQVLQYNGKFIKVEYAGQPTYAGLNDVVYDPAHSYGITSTLFGLFLDQSQDTDDGDILQGYIAHYVEDNKERDKQRVTVKTVGRGEISSNYYHNIFLAYIDCTFKVSGSNVDLTAFDVEYERRK